VSKSVVIVGKGIGVLKSTREFMNSFDEVAFCNFPPIEGYEKYIGTRCDWMFANMWDPNPYQQFVFEKIQIKHLLNTHIKPYDNIMENPIIVRLFSNPDMKYTPDYGTTTIEEIKTKYGFDPSTGIQAFNFFVKNPEYDTIGLVGFDNFKVGEKAYYYSVDEVQPTLKYLYTDGDTPYTKDGVRRTPTLHGSTELMENYIKETSELYNVTIRKPE
tara:strand:- start:3002 stop:3646 length:645 start_codon:yes stop_codon:yes gene_type:complete